MSEHNTVVEVLRSCAAIEEGESGGGLHPRISPTGGETYIYPPSGDIIAGQHFVRCNTR